MVMASLICCLVEEECILACLLAVVPGYLKLMLKCNKIFSEF